MNNSVNYGDEYEDQNPLNQAFFEPGPENEGLEEGEMLFGNEEQESVDPNETIVSPNAVKLDTEESDDEVNISSYNGSGGRRKSRKTRKTKSRKATRKARKTKSKSRKVRNVRKTKGKSRKGKKTVRKSRR